MADKPSSSEEQADLRARNLEYYKWRLNTFTDNRMTHDKTILQLSSAGIGLIGTLFTAFHAQLSNRAVVVIFLGSGAIFAGTIWLVLQTFRANADHLLTDNEDKKKKAAATMKRNDSIVQWSFPVGILSLLMASATLLYTLGGENLMSEKKNQSNRMVDGSEPGSRKNSLDGYDSFNPARPSPNTTESGGGQQGGGGQGTSQQPGNSGSNNSGSGDAGE